MLRDSKAHALLAKRMAEFNIPPWPGQAMFERVIVYRIPDEASDRETFADGGAIIKPESSREVQKSRSPRGVVVSAGLQAMDVLADHGMALGELVWFSPHVPFRFEVERNEEGKPVEFYFMNVGDIVLSEDVLARVASEEVLLARIGGKHTYQHKGDKAVKYVSPKEPIQRAEPSKNADDI